MILNVAALLIAYLIGAVPFGLILFNLGGPGGDIRRKGSGNIGATNAFRAGGKTVGVLTLLLDIGKGALAVLIARQLADTAGWIAATAFMAVLGHCHPVYLRFKGGKGIATGCGAYGALAPMPMAVTLGVFITILLISRTVSLGSIAAGLALPLILWWRGADAALLLSAAAAVLLVIARHHDNIKRLLAGEESRIHGT